MSAVAHFTPTLLTEVRRLARAPEQELPIALHYEVQSRFRIARAEWLEGAGPDTMRAGLPVVQVRYATSWVVVDAAIDRSYAASGRGFSDSLQQRIDTLLVGARAVVLTHEHYDHAGGILRSRRVDDFRPHTVLTTEQRDMLVHAPYREDIRLDSATAARYRLLGYRRIHRLAPGVVLIEAPGHSPGSQLVYVRTRDGREVILAGDASWTMEGLRTGRHKPEAWTRRFGGEDRAQVTAVMDWLRQVEGEGVRVLVAHDMQHFDEMTAAGVLTFGFDLGGTARH